MESLDLEAHPDQATRLCLASQARFMLAADALSDDDVTAPVFFLVGHEPT
ncbi:hypothetical protein [Kocuria sp.]|nr:hypothetical protein [Kocuria sp.]MDO5618072.1 hypothetical protein [Kocuria sp.]